MRQRRIVLAALAIGLLGPRDAAAGCETLGPYLGTGLELPLGCPLHVYAALSPSFVPQVTVLRNGAYVNATGAVTMQPVQLQVERTFFDCALQTQSTQTAPALFDRWELRPSGVQVGERVGIGSGWFGGIEIKPAGPCAAPIEPKPSCSQPAMCPSEPPFESFEPGSCSARRPGGLLTGLVLLGLVPLARRRRRR